MDTRVVIDRMQKKEAVVGVVGLGYVGLPLVLTFSRKGYNVVGFDIDPNKVRQLENKESYIRHISAKDIGTLVESGRFTPTTDYSRAASCDALILCVPTPLNKNREPDMSYIEGTASSLGPHVGCSI